MLYDNRQWGRTPELQQGPRRVCPQRDSDVECIEALCIERTFFHVAAGAGNSASELSLSVSSPVASESALSLSRVTGSGPGRDAPLRFLAAGALLAGRLPLPP